MTTNARISRLRGIALGAPGAVGAKAFYEEAWGLETVAEASGELHLRGTGAEHHILSLYDREPRGIVYVNFAAQDLAALEALLAHAAAAGVAIAAGIRDLDTPGGGIGFDIVDPDNRLLRISAQVDRYPDAPDAPDRPRKITHVVLNTPDLEGALGFYQDVLGFRVSDWSENQMVFIRCNNDHHSISFNRAPHASLNHVAFEMPNIDAEMKGIGRLKQHQKEVGWGIGRHGPGNNVFAYFTDPNDFVVEYTTEIEQIDEATHEPQVWKRIPHLRGPSTGSGSGWGVARPRRANSTKSELRSDRPPSPTLPLTGGGSRTALAIRGTN